MNSLQESKVEVYVDDKMLKEFGYLLPKHGPKSSCGIILKDYIQGLDLDSINDIYMKEQAIAYYIEGPTWRHDDFLLERSWFKGFEAGCANKGRFLSLKFNIDQYCVSKLQKTLINDEE